MKVLHYKSTMRAEEGGVVKAVLDLCAATSSTGAAVTVATHDAEQVPTELRDRGLNVHALAHRRSRRGLVTKALRAELRHLVDEHDIVHLHGMWELDNIQVARLARAHKRPYIVSVHGMLDDWSMSQRRLKKIVFLRTFGRGLLPHCAAVHCTAKAELSQASRWFDATKGFVIGLPLDLEPFRDLPGEDLAIKAFPGLGESVPKVLFLSRIHYKKGVETLIEASRMLLEQGIHHRLVIAGTGDPEYTNHIRGLAERTLTDGQCVFTGFTQGVTKVSLFQACDVFVLPTSQENFGYVYFESMASGTPVITTKGADTWPELSEAGAWIVEQSADAIADAIKSALTDRPATRRRGQRGRYWVFEHLDAATVGQQFADACQSILRKTGAKP